MKVRKRILSILMTVVILLCSTPIHLPVSAISVSLENMPMIDEGHYTGNLGDSRVFNLNRNGLPGNDNEYCRNGNIALDGTVCNNGFEVWIARWNFGDKISWAYATFDIGGKYTSLIGKTNIIKGSYNTSCFDSTVYFYDGNNLLASYRLTNNDYIKDINVNVSGVQTLKLLVQDNIETAGGTSFALYDLLLDSDNAQNIYNRGEETYSFKNFKDKDSGGHCFGMSVTSSFYYLGLEKIPVENQTTYELECSNEAVRAPICYYHAIQGSYRDNAIVAGGYYFSDAGNEEDYNILWDWNSIISYVKNHEYDGKGSLVINYLARKSGAHTVNFLRYENIDGQDRIYIYDSNFPKIETYLYQNGEKIYQAPKSTFTGEFLFWTKKNIDCISLVDVYSYFDNAKEYRPDLAIYSEADTITVSKSKESVMAMDDVDIEYLMYELPDNITEVEITPLKNNAEFSYMGQTYSFEEISENTVGILKLANPVNNNNSVEFKVIESDPDQTDEPLPNDPSANCNCSCHKSGFIKFLWKILNFFRHIFGMEKYHYCSCGRNHWK